MIFNMIPLPMHPAIASHRDKVWNDVRIFGSDRDQFVCGQDDFKVTVMAYLMVKFTSAVTEITFSGADIRLLVDKITFVAAEKLLKWL